ncbi:MAG: HlyD family efflux transporter periplasmic adaptor subunit [Bacillota bacterium]
MKEIILDLNEITDSRELLESKPHPFTVIFIYILIGILTVTLSWSYFGEMDVVVKANGVVRPNQRISTINNMVTGKVEEVYLEEGKRVKKGELLYAIDYSELQTNKEFIEEELSKKRLEMDNLNTFKKSILEGKNGFNLENKEQEAYYYKYLKFEADKKQAKENANLIITKINSVKVSIENIKILLSSIEQNKNLFQDTENEYYIKYLDYNLKLKELQRTTEQRTRDFTIQEKLYQAGAVSKIEYENAKDSKDKSELELEKYINGTKLDLKSILEENQRMLKELDIQLQQTAPGTPQYVQDHTDIAVQNFKTENLILLNDQITKLETEINQLENNLETLKLDIQNCIVKAPIDGYINIYTDINKGDSLQGGTSIATIIPDNDSNYKVQIYASNEDITNIKVGDKVRYNFLALPYKEYGELTGKITRIAKDTKINKEGNASFYLVEADIENKPLVSYKGEEARIKVGMACEVRIVTKTKKILHYLLEKIDLRF